MTIGPSYPYAWRRGFSLAESMLAVAIVSGLVVVSMNTVGACKVSQQNTGERATGQLLAAALMSEILSRDYSDPQGSVLHGVELGESAANRTLFDDVDDYHGWSESPPKNQDGTVMAHRTGWRRSVSVALIHPDNANQSLLVDSGVKRITVTVTFNGREAARITALRTGSPTGLVIPDIIPIVLDIL